MHFRRMLTGVLCSCRRTAEPFRRYAPAAQLRHLNINGCLDTMGPVHVDSHVESSLSQSGSLQVRITFWCIMFSKREEQNDV